MTAASSQSPWGWTAPVRVLLALIAVGGGALLVALAPGAPGPARGVPPLVVDPNTAPPQVLAALPKLGPSLVRRIVEARAQAPFRSLDDLDARVRGIGPATIAALRPYLRITPAAAPADAPLPASRVAQNAR